MSATSTNDAVAVLVHGVPGGPASWRQVRERLDANHPGLDHQTVAVPGWERTTPGTPEDLSYASVIDRIEAQVSPDCPVVLVGFSFGGLLSLSLAAQGTIDVRRMLLIDPMLFPLLRLGGFEEAHVLVDAMMAAYVADIEAGAPDAFGPVSDVWVGPGAYGRMPERAKDYLRSAGPLTARVIGTTLTATFEREQFAPITCPVLATWGGAGSDIWQRFTDSLQVLVPQTLVRCFDGADHDVLSTHPTEVAALIAAEVAALG